ncbi:pro-sigmaK processing inhibitor BofA family protein [Paenibacillus sp. GCM10023248]|uniref:pro-sigmaK processing inhibitor BofA family protein n=1 Tax=Bacillales TaxID=1385 RepID=UPI002378D259|nr:MULTISPECIES: pro-sigmaK processing inhibitor BofA family protein [Bacillales]MDD9270545.1 pro-sigmaK processing inhibitor BofA family protein [Paenibacillus sp. MAHUQ-63]MDR6885486.1 inhibitor of the pro-sigma K processing machinery [Bacillus sp. 3255]
MYTQYAVWGVLILSSLMLLIVVLRNRSGGRLLSALCLNVVVAAFLLYGLNLLSDYTHVELPINTATLGTVTFLGVPGVLLLVGLKLVLI